METLTKRAPFRILSLKESVFITLEINVLFFFFNIYIKCLFKYIY